jgi:hypothetical protein
MTIPDTQAEDELAQVPEPQEPAQYFISFDRLAELRRSPIVLIGQRRVPSCPSLQTPDHELNDPQKLVNEIAQHFDDEEGFIKSEMSIQEIAFRLLLSRRNKPMLLTDLHYELTERWSTPFRPINMTEDGLRRVLEADTYYGFAKVPPEK